MSITNDYSIMEKYGFNKIYYSKNTVLKKLSSLLRDLISQNLPNLI